MKLTFYSPVVFVKDIIRSKKFYIDLLEQEVEFDFGANIIFKSHLSLWSIASGHEIEKIKGDASKGNTFELYFETEDIITTVARIKEYGIKLFHEIKTESWGQMTIRFFDPDNHLIEIGESLKTFTTRIYLETLSVEETSLKTGVSVTKIREIVNQ